MSATLPPPSLASARTASETTDTKTVRIDELIVGRTTHFPIYDARGLLLVAEGLTITPEIKRSLHARSGGHVVVHAADVGRLTLLQTNLPASGGIQLDNETTRKLDEIINRGFFPVVNRERALKETFARHGRKAYGAEQGRRLAAQHEENVGAISDMMLQALHGESVDGATATAMTANYLQEMAADSEHVLSSVATAFQTGALSTNSLAVSILSMALGVEMGFDGDNVRDLGVCGLVHDWGMLRVPEAVRNAPHRLTPEERVEITKHPIYSLEILEKISALPRITPLVVYQIHERPNGQGYPRGRTGKNIHMFAKVVQVADSYTALTSRRPYRVPLMPYSAMECLVRQAKDRYVDPDVVRALLRIQSLFPLGSLVTLSDGSAARVLRSNGDDYTRPIVQRIQDAEGNSTDPMDDANVIDLTNASVSIRQAIPTPGRDEAPLTEEVLTVY